LVEALSVRQALADSSGARKEKTLATFLLLGFKLVAWDGIEPSTRGFSIAVFVKSPAFMRVTSE
jgi:hypothetical protein